MYSAKTADRFVSINDRALHEGDELSPGVKLEKITFDGMILSYKGYRFRRGIN
jgi:general secretion pathway protein B